MTFTQAHQQKQKRLADGNAPRLLDLFAGCGSISLGFQAAGFEIVGHKVPAETCKRNYFADDR